VAAAHSSCGRGGCLVGACLLRITSRSIDTDFGDDHCAAGAGRKRSTARAGAGQLAHTEGLIANQFELISDRLTLIDPDVLDRHRTAENVSSMATLAGSQIERAARAFVSRDFKLAGDLSGRTTRSTS
jgi:hypothetical protein